MIHHLRYLPGLTPVDFFLYWRVKSELAGISLFHNSFKTSCDGVIQTMAKEKMPFSGGWTAAKSVSESAVTRPEEGPK